MLQLGHLYSGPNLWLIMPLVSFMHFNMKLWGPWFPGGEIILGIVSTAVSLASSLRIPFRNYSVPSVTIK